MDISKYGKLVIALCDECWAEGLLQAWESGPPDWLSRFEDGDFCIHSCPEYDLWRAIHVVPQHCLMAEETFTLCSKHLTALAELVK